ncbi:MULTISPECIES: thiopurine S-methyltransferase [Ferrimonas]|uniref:thiopurine S-methyltransferase n=1 Tax=Ferrimonas TaxID=44011 RepID=UPI0003F51EF6|nr:MULTISPECIES: thiopurine S-methyltransferase [Ferrimonas]USD37969.1 thiopurine S-methyltransferase [Ferrimonas sp. SCSIO 43195]
MDAAFWHDKWDRQLIGFHQDDINPFLKRHWPAISHSPGRVLVPLCGKSLDMVWLASLGDDIVGSELSESAVRSFFNEQQLEPVSDTHGELTRFCDGPFELWRGDLFALSPEHIKPVTAFYDRAALIALPEPMRQRYWQHLASLLPAGTPGLLITLDYPQQQLSGPPFSVTESWVRQHSEGLFEVELLERSDVLADNPRFVKKQVASLDELVFKLTRL